MAEEGRFPVTRDTRAGTRRRSMGRNNLSIYTSLSETTLHMSGLRRSSRLAKKHSHIPAGPIRQASSTRFVGTKSKREAALGHDKDSQIASKLCSSTLEFFLLTLNQEQWAFRDVPRPETDIFPSITNLLTEDKGKDSEQEVNDDTSSCGDAYEVDRYASAYDDGETEADIMSQPPESVSGDIMSWIPKQPDNEGMLRFFLREERNKLCLWKFTFSDEDLDAVVFANLGDPNHVGNSILESLASIACALVGATKLPSRVPTDSVGAESDEVTKIHSLARELFALSTQARNFVRTAAKRERSSDGDTVISDATTHVSSSTLAGQNSIDTAAEDTSDLLGIVRSNVRRLQRLNFAIRLELNGMKE